MDATPKLSLSAVALAVMGALLVVSCGPQDPSPRGTPESRPDPASRFRHVTGRLDCSDPIAGEREGNTLCQSASDDAVTLNDPGEGSLLSGTVSLMATTPDDSTVDSMEFLDGDTVIGTATAMPFTFDWNTQTVASGSHALSARATDTTGNTATSTPVNVTVNNRGPLVVISAPTWNPQTQNYIRGTVTVAATATDTGGGVGHVDFLVDGTLLGAGTGGAGSSYTFNWNTTTATRGAHVLTARATDLVGNVTVSEGQSLIVDNDAPFISFSFPHGDPNFGYVSQSVSLQIVGNDATSFIRQVSYTLDGSPLATVTNAPSFQYTWVVTNVANGTHLLKATGLDAAGNVSNVTQVSMTVDHSPPTVSITAPAAGATVSGTVTLSATASDNTGVYYVEFDVDGVMLSQDATAPYSTTWNASAAAPGSHTITVKAVDRAGNVSTVKTITVTVAAP